MNKVNRIAALLLVVASWQVAEAQQYPLAHRSSIEIALGLWNEAKASNQMMPNGAPFGARSNGFLGELSYTYWPQENLALTIAVGIISAEATTNYQGPFLTAGWNQQASTVMPILFGVKYYFLEPLPNSFAKPYLYGDIGPTLGFEATNTAILQQAHTESSLGTRFGAGVDVLLGRSVKFGANAGYFLMTDFKEPIGARSNYNGPALAFTIGFVFGSPE